MKCVKILTKNSVTSKVLIIAKQHLFKLILNSLRKFPNVSVIWKWKKWSWYHHRSDPPHFLRVEWILIISFKGREIWKILKSEWKYGVGVGFLEKGLTLFLFDIFKVYYFYVYKLFYSFQNCVIYLKKNYFFLPP